MRIIQNLLLLATALTAASCSDATLPEQETSGLSLSFVTRVTGPIAGTGTGNLQGMNFDKAPNWGLYAYTPEGEPIFGNAKIAQDDGDLGYSTEAYKPSTFADGDPDNTTSLGGMILSAYYPYLDTDKPENVVDYETLPLDDEKINPRFTTNSLGHPAVHYGIPDYRLARHPQGAAIPGENGLFNFGTETNPQWSNPARDVVLFSCYKHVNATQLNSGSPVKIELTPTTCRIAFIFSIAPRFDSAGNMLPDNQQPDPLDYEIVSVRRRRTGYKDPGGEVTHTNFNYDLKTGKITDMRFKTGGLYFKFPELGEAGYNAAWGPVRPYAVDYTGDRISCLEFVSLPTLYDDLKNIEFEIVYKYRLIAAADPLVDEDVWVTSTCRIHADSTYLIQGWNSGRIYNYHIYISRHEVDYQVEIVPWEFDPEQDQFFGDIQA